MANDSYIRFNDDDDDDDDDDDEDVPDYLNTSLTVL